VFVLTGDDVVVHENRERARRKDHRRRHLTSAPRVAARRPSATCRAATSISRHGC